MVAKFLIWLIRVYQLLLSPLLGNVCRFHPSCSNYGLKCIEYHGAIRGTGLTLRRLSRCHPFNPGGYDPPPPPRDSSAATAESPTGNEAETRESEVDAAAGSGSKTRMTESPPSSKHDCRCPV